MNLKDFLSNLEADALKTGAFKMPVAEAKEKGLCVCCGEPALPKCYSSAGCMEYRISGLCEPCYDATMKVEGE